MSNITRNRPKAVWEAKDSILRNGEYGFEEDTGKLKQGDGVKRWSQLAYLDVPPYTLPKSNDSLIPARLSEESLRATFGTTRKLLGSKFAFFGDSITAYGEGFPVYASILSNQSINWSAERTFSHSGHTSGQLAALTGEITSLDPLPQVVHIHVGANDAQGLVPLTTYRENMLSIIDDMREAGVEVVIGGVLPLGASNSRPYVRQYNDWLRQHCAAESIPFIDNYRHTADRVDGSPLATMITGDGVHPTPLGQKTMGQLLADTLAVVLPSVSAPTAVDNEDNTNLILHPLALVDTDVNGVADDWYVQGSTAGWTFSLVDDDDATGKWVRMVGSGAAAQGTISPGAVTSGFSAGDVLSIATRIRVSGTAGATSQLYVQIQALAANFTLLDYAYLIGGISQPVEGISWIEFVVPEGTARLILYVQGGPGNGTYEVADPSIINLTALGID